MTSAWQAPNSQWTNRGDSGSWLAGVGRLALGQGSWPRLAPRAALVGGSGCPQQLGLGLRLFRNASSAIVSTLTTTAYSWHRGAQSGETGGANGRRLLEDRGVVGAYSPCGCSAPARDGSTVDDRVLGVSTREPGHRGTARRLHARRVATVFLGNSQR